MTRQPVPYRGNDTLLKVGAKISRKLISVLVSARRIPLHRPFADSNKLRWNTLS